MAAAAPHKKRIAVCVDDFGLHEGVNDATLRLAQLGRITAVSCMTGASHWAAGAARLAKLPQERIDAGLHLDLTEHPLGAGMRWPLPALMARSSARLLDPVRLRGEIHAQLDRFEQGLGRAPAHIDGHQHVHQFPVIREALIHALLERYPHRRPWLRVTRRPIASGRPGFKQWLIERLGCKPFTELARANGYPHNASLLGVYDFQGDAARYLSLVAQWLGAARHGDVLMCHPGLATQAPDPILGARRNEYDILSGAAFSGLLAQAGVELAPLSRLLAAD